MGPEESNIGRRNFLQMTGAGIVAASTAATATQALASTRAANSEFSAGITPQPSPEFAPDLTAADIMVETLISWGATRAFRAPCPTRIATFRPLFRTSAAARS